MTIYDKDCIYSFMKKCVHITHLTDDQMESFWTDCATKFRSQVSDSVMIKRINVWFRTEPGYCILQDDNSGNTLKSAIMERDNIIKSLKKQNDERDLKITHLQNEVRQLQAQLGSAQQSFEVANKDDAKLIVMLKQTNHDIAIDMENLKKEIENLKKEHKDKSDSVILDQKKEIEHLKYQLSHDQKTANVGAKVLNDDKKLTKLAKDKANQFNLELESRDTKIKEQAQEIHVLKTRMAKIDSRTDAAQILALKGQLLTYKSDNERLKKSNENYRRSAVSTNYPSVATMVDSGFTKTSIIDPRIEELTDIVRIRDGQIMDLWRKINSKYDEIEDLKDGQELASLKSQISQWKAHDEETLKKHNQLVCDYNNLREDHNGLVDDCNKLREDNYRAEGKIKDLQHQVKQLQSKIKMIDYDKEYSVRYAESISREKDNLLKEFSNNYRGDDVANLLEKITQHNGELQAEITNLRREVRAANKENELLQSKNDKLYDKIKDIEELLHERGMTLSKG